MPSECIHGFDEGLCDICYPKAPVVKPRSAARKVTPQRSPRATATRASTTRATATRTPPVNLLDQRVFHVTHLRNLEAIVEAGSVHAFEQAAGAQTTDEQSTGDQHPSITVDLSSDLARELRATAEVGAASNETVGAASVSTYVPWYLSADASVWQELRRGAAESRWSAAARAAASVDFVVLVTTVRALAALDGFAVADGDAAGTFTTFATDNEQAMRMLARLHNTEQLLGAEVLVAGSVPFASVQLIGVANEPQRDRVRAVLDAAAAARPKVAVYPPWFAAPE